MAIRNHRLSAKDLCSLKTSLLTAILLTADGYLADS